MLDEIDDLFLVVKDAGMHEVDFEHLLAEVIGFDVRDEVDTLFESWQIDIHPLDLIWGLKPVSVALAALVLIKVLNLSWHRAVLKHLELVVVPVVVFDDKVEDGVVNHLLDLAP